jgi:hypothetical protein
MRFSLKTRQILTLRQSYIKKEECKVMRNTTDPRTYSEMEETSTPFGIEAVVFQDRANDEILEGKDTLDEIRFMD